MTGAVKLHLVVSVPSDNIAMDITLQTGERSAREWGPGEDSRSLIALGTQHLLFCPGHHSNRSAEACRYTCWGSPVLMPCHAGREPWRKPAGPHSWNKASVQGTECRLHSGCSTLCSLPSGASPLASTQGHVQAGCAKLRKGSRHLVCIRPLLVVSEKVCFSENEAFCIGKVLAEIIEWD